MHGQQPGKIADYIYEDGLYKANDQVGGNWEEMVSLSIQVEWAAKYLQNDYVFGKAQPIMEKRNMMKGHSGLRLLGQL